MKRAADHRQDEAKNQVRADDLWRRHFRVVQKQHGPESAGPGGGKSRFHADGEREPRQPAGILSSETWILYARGERHAGRRGEQDSEQDDDDRISSLLSYESQHQRAEEETGDGPEEKQPQIARVKVLSQEIERRGDQAQDSRMLTFQSWLPVGRRSSSTYLRFLRVGDCSRRKPVNQTSNGSNAARRVSTLRNWQQRVGSVW